MKKLIILLTLALSFSFANAEKFSGLKAKDYKNVSILVEDIGKSNTGLTNQDILNKIKLTLLRNGFKISNDESKDYIYIRVQVMALDDKVNDVYTININYTKYSYKHFNTIAERNSAGVFFVPYQGNYGVFGISPHKSDITEAIQDSIESFLVDYIESNTE